MRIPYAGRSDELNEAAAAGDVPGIERLLASPDRPSQNACSAALVAAAEAGQTEALSLLLPWSDPGFDSFRALRRAANGGHAAAVGVLLPYSDREARSRSLLLALMHPWPVVWFQLLPFADVDGVFTQLLRSGTLLTADLLSPHVELATLHQEQQWGRLIHMPSAMARLAEEILEDGLPPEAPPRTVRHRL